MRVATACTPFIPAARWMAARAFDFSKKGGRASVRPARLPRLPSIWRQWQQVLSAWPAPSCWVGGRWTGSAWRRGLR
eukprot:13278092-Heterocapsa_arctica.AAC.1